MSGLLNEDLDIKLFKFLRCDDNLYDDITNNLYITLEILTTDLKRSTDSVVRDR
jgi:hypothetical protein